MEPVFERPAPAPVPMIGARLQRFGPVGVLAIVIIVLAGNLAGAVLTLLWRWMTRTPWRELGFVRSRRCALDIGIGISAGIALKLLMRMIVLPLLGFAGSAGPYYYLAGNAAALPGMLFTVIVGAGFGEELIWRGFLFNRVRAVFGNSRGVVLGGLAATSLAFGLTHCHDQGVAGLVQATITGLTFGSAYLATRRIWPVMIAHAAYDVAAVMMIYYRVELPVSHWLVR